MPIFANGAKSRCMRSSIVSKSVAIGVGYLVAHQFVVLSEKLPQYQGNLKHKMQSFHARDGAFSKFQSTIKDFKKEMAASQPATATSGMEEGPTPSQVVKE